MKSVVVDSSAYDWEGDKRLHRPADRTIIYDTHVRNFTRHPSSGLSENVRGTYAGLIEKIPCLRKLGINAVELLPVFQFDTQNCPHGLTNYWGYAPISFFTPHRAYSSRQDPLGPVDEFRDMVKALHRTGMRLFWTSVSITLRKATIGAHPMLPRAGQQCLLHSRTGPLQVRQLQRYREHG